MAFSDLYSLRTLHIWCFRVTVKVVAGFFVKFLARALVVVALLTCACVAFGVVDMKNANYSESWLDLNVAGVGFDLQVRRMYNSRSLFSGMFGFGWCADFETRLSVLPTGGLLIKECGGGLEITYESAQKAPNVNEQVRLIVQEVRKRNPSRAPGYFTKLKADLLKSDRMRKQYLQRVGRLKGGTAPSKGKQYIARGGQDQRVQFNGREYTRFLPDGSMQKFNTKGQLVYMYDRSANYLKVHYSKGRVHSLTDNLGRSLYFDYPKSADSKRVQKVRGPSGKSATYEYEGELLVGVANMWGSNFVYKYGELNNLRYIGYPDKTTKELTYDAARDWVTSFKDRAGCLESYSYTVSPKGKSYYKSQVKKTCKGEVVNRSTYEFWYKTQKGGGIYLARTRSDINGKKREVQYGSQFGRPLVINQGGSKTRLAYYPTGRLKSRSTPYSVAQFRYDPKCKKIARVESVFKVQKSKAHKKGQKKITTRFVYEPKKCYLQRASNSEGLQVALTYDRYGRVVKMVDQSKKSLLITYDESSGRPRRVNRPDMGSIQMSYDSLGNISSIKSQEGQKVALQVASMFSNFLELISLASASVV